MAELVTVACKHPHGIHLDLMGDPEIFTGPNGEKHVVANLLKRVTVRGSADARRLENDGKIVGEVGHVIGNYGLTPNIDKDFWDAWLKQNESYPMVKNGLLFAMPQLNSVKSEAKSRAAVESGLEPINPAKPGADLTRLDEKAELGAA